MRILTRVQKWLSSDRLSMNEGGLQSKCRKIVRHRRGTRSVSAKRSRFVILPQRRISSSEGYDELPQQVDDGTEEQDLFYVGHRRFGTKDRR